MIRSELEKYGISPSKRLGQHFLIDTAVRDKLIRYADLQSNDTVLEVGPGTGFLTAALLHTAGEVLAVEKDPRLVEILRRKLGRFRRLKIIEGDALTVKLPSFRKVVSTPPYNISSKLVLRLSRRRFQKAAMTLQDEFAKRLAAEPGSEHYGRISVMARHRLDVRLQDLVPRDVFIPRPDVNSRIVELSPRRIPAENKNENEDVFIHLVRGLFTQRRRVIRSALKHYLSLIGVRDPRSVLSSLDMPEARVYQLDIPDFEKLACELTPTLASVVAQENDP